MFWPQHQQVRGSDTKTHLKSRFGAILKKGENDKFENQLACVALKWMTSPVMPDRWCGSPSGVCEPGKKSGKMRLSAVPVQGLLVFRA